MDKELIELSAKLRPIQTNELELMLSWRNAPSVRANMYTRHEISLAEHLQWWQATIARHDQRYFMYESNGRPRGIVGFTRIDAKSGHCSWAFYADPVAPKGSGTEMEFLALEYAFGALGMRRLHCEVLAFNHPVQRLHQKFGFQIEGRLREHHVDETGPVDVILLGILRHEWHSQREQMHARILTFQQK